MQIAQLLGYQNFAEYNLEERMAQNSGNVYKLLRQLLDAYKPAAQKEYLEVQKIAQEREGEHFQLMPWRFRLRTSNSLPIISSWRKAADVRWTYKT